MLKTLISEYIKFLFCCAIVSVDCPYFRKSITRETLYPIKEVQKKNLGKESMIDNHIYRFRADEKNLSAAGLK